jgi:chromosome segregation ATPase
MCCAVLCGCRVPVQLEVEHENLVLRQEVENLQFTLGCERRAHAAELQQRERDMAQLRGGASAAASSRERADAEARMHAERELDRVSEQLQTCRRELVDALALLRGCEEARETQQQLLLAARRQLDSTAEDLPRLRAADAELSQCRQCVEMARCDVVSVSLRCADDGPMLCGQGAE